jgi:iron complex transport system substrate-binding protein
MFPPQRIVCLSAETVETLYLLGAADRIVGITGFATRPPQARREKPVIAAYTSADLDAILDLAPDLVLGFSDLQADIAAALVRSGIEVHVFNQRGLAGILDMIASLGALVGAAAAAAALVAGLAARIAEARARAAGRRHRPRVYFEEWDEPMICGIGWISELVDLAGGIDIFADRARAPGAAGRIVRCEEIVARAPEIILASWCGKKFRAEQLAARPGFSSIPAVRSGALHEIAAPLVLQPGPAVLTDGLAAVERLIAGLPAPR